MKGRGSFPTKGGTQNNAGGKTVAHLKPGHRGSGRGHKRGGRRK